MTSKDTDEEKDDKLFQPSSTSTYQTSHRRRKDVTNSIVKDLIIGYSMPLSLVERPGFRKCMEVLDARYKNVSRKSVTAIITLGGGLVKALKDSLIRAIRGSVLTINMDDQTATQNTLSEASQRLRTNHPAVHRDIRPCRLPRGVQCT